MGNNSLMKEKMDGERLEWGWELEEKVRDDSGVCKMKEDHLKIRKPWGIIPFQNYEVEEGFMGKEIKERERGRAVGGTPWR